MSAALLYFYSIKLSYCLTKVLYCFFVSTLRFGAGIKPSSRVTVRRNSSSLFLTQIGLKVHKCILGIMVKNIDLLSVVDSFKDFQDATKSGSSFGALLPAHLHKVHIWCWSTVRGHLGPTVWFDSFPYIEEYF